MTGRLFQQRHELGKNSLLPVLGWKGFWGFTQVNEGMPSNLARDESALECTRKFHDNALQARSAIDFVIIDGSLTKSGV
ncbi:hypothetical protein ACLKA6_013407 [Drosophila palustris]